MNLQIDEKRKLPFGLITHDFGSMAALAEKKISLPGFVAILDESSLACTPAGSEPQMINQGNLLILPAQQRFHFAPHYSPFRWLSCGINETGFRCSAIEHELDHDDLEQCFADVKLIKRTIWIDQLINRLAFECFVSNKQSGLAIEFLVLELLKEIFYASLGLNRKVTVIQPRLQDDHLLLRAFHYIDKHLDGDFTLEDLASFLGISVSTLMRVFNSHLQQTPRSYIRNRRMERAHFLISSQQHSIGDVAQMVGYQDVSAFSAAFKKRFQILPSQLAAQCQKSLHSEP